MKRNANRQKKPKSLRFSRFFLRSLIPCLLAAGFFSAYRLRSFGEEHEDDTKNLLQSFTEQYITDEAEWENLVHFREDLTDAEFEEQYGIGRLSFLLTMMTKSNISFSCSECEKTALLLDPETGEWYFPVPAVMLIGRGGPEYSQDGKKSIFLSEPEETEQIIRAYRDYYASKRPVEQYEYYFEYVLEEILPFGGIGSKLGGKLSEWLGTHYEPEIPETESAYVKGHQCRGLTWQIPGGPSGSSDLSLPAPWKLLIPNKKMSEEDQELIKLSMNGEIDPAAAPEYLFGSGFFSVYGQPSDFLTSRAAREIVAACQTEYETQYSKLQDWYEEHMASAEQSGGIEYLYDEEWTTEDIQARYETQLDNFRSRMGDQALEFFRDYQYHPEADSSLTKKEWNSLAANNWGVTINGRDYSLFYMVKDDDPWVFYRPVIILNCVILLIAVLLLSLILALIPHLRAKRRYARDEYRRSLTAALAHDLKSPLTAISGYAENLESGVHPEKQAYYAGAIQDSTRYMDSLITNALDLAKLEQDETAKKTAVDLITLAKAHLAHRGDEITKRNMQVEILGEYTVRADRRMLSQAIQNLLDNAFKFTPDGGSIRITGDGKALRITNSIAEERIPDVERLCEAFVKGDSARSNQSGSGLGLSVVRQAARLNRMQFTVESRDHQFITALADGIPTSLRKRAAHRARNLAASLKEHRAARRANRVMRTNLTAPVKAQIQAHEQELSARNLQSKVTGDCVLYARPLDMETVAEAAVTLALRMMPDGSALSVTGEGNALRIRFPADRTRIGSDELRALLGQMRKKVRRSKLRFAAEEEAGQMTLTVSEKPLFFRPIRLRKR